MSGNPPRHRNPDALAVHLPLPLIVSSCVLPLLTWPMEPLLATISVALPVLKSQRPRLSRNGDGRVIYAQTPVVRLYAACVLPLGGRKPL